jgi:hypothetical protein
MEKTIHSYPKVLALGHRYIENITDGSFHFEEKLDGSQISFMVDGTGELHIRSKGAMLVLDAPEAMFNEAVASIREREHLLEQGWIYRGEYLKKPKHNTLVYNRIPNGHIIIFDIETAPNNFMDYERKSNEAERIGLECIPKLEYKHDGIDFLSGLKTVIEKESCLGGPHMEGVVMKNYERITPDGKFMVGKYVSEAFKESHSKNWKADNPSKGDIITQIIDTLKTDARFDKAVQRLRDNGELTQSPKDIGALMKVVHEDIEKEESEFIKDKLYQFAIKNIKRGVCGPLPQWYKDKLITGLDLEV